jgi:hypothetical protein
MTHVMCNVYKKDFYFGAPNFFDHVFTPLGLLLLEG